MKQLDALKKDLESQYNIPIEEFLYLYAEGMKLKALIKHFNTSPWQVKMVGSTLNLRFARKYRQGDLAMLTLRSNDKADDSLIVQLKEQAASLEQLSADYVTQAKALIKTRQQANILRSSLRKESNIETLQESLLETLISTSSKQSTKINLQVTTPESTRFNHHTSSLLLSDLHAEELVTAEDVGKANQYNWRIMEERLAQVFSAWFTSLRGEKRGIVFLGADFFSGIIHQSLENATLPIAEAIVQLADLLSGYILTASDIFPELEVLFINGNHSRISENIKSAKKGFDFEYLFAQLLKSKLPKVSFSISTTGYVATTIGTKVVGLHHGDHFRGPVFGEARTFKVYEMFKAVLGIEVDTILQGHTHNFSHHNTHRGHYIVNGSLIGSNAYGVTNGFSAIRASQTIITFEPSGEVENVRQVFVN